MAGLKRRLEALEGGGTMMGLAEYAELAALADVVPMREGQPFVRVDLARPETWPSQYQGRQWSPGFLAAVERLPD